MRELPRLTGVRAGPPSIWRFAIGMTMSPIDAPTSLSITRRASSSG